MKARYEVRLDFVLFQKREWRGRPEQWFTSEEQAMLREAYFFDIRRERRNQALWFYLAANP